MLQPSLPSLGAPLPDGFTYAEAFVSGAEHDALLARITGLPFASFTMRGVVARRRVVHFGWDYDYERRGVRAPAGDAVAPIPGFLLPLRERCAALAGEEPRRFEEALATFYPPGASIGWHRDAPQFGTVVGVSFGAACRLRFRLDGAPAARHAEVVLAPGSAYVLAGAARWAWQHHIPSLRSPRWSVTFRTVQPSRAARSVRSRG